MSGLTRFIPTYFGNSDGDLVFSVRVVAKFSSFLVTAYFRYDNKNHAHFAIYRARLFIDILVEFL
ncbi:hypothetical protein TUM3792_44820 [Shewanella sp. MBTL60-007]|nr:hypothetical protein TUM3792_44820 [Shewanella sp. MBTL60-007]